MSFFPIIPFTIITTPAAAAGIFTAIIFATAVSTAVHHCKSWNHWKHAWVWCIETIRFPDSQWLRCVRSRWSTSFGATAPRLNFPTIDGNLQHSADHYICFGLRLAKCGWCKCWLGGKDKARKTDLLQNFGWVQLGWCKFCFFHRWLVSKCGCGMLWMF